MNKKLIAFLVAIAVFICTGTISVKAVKPDNPGNSMDNPSVVNSQKPVRDDNEQQQGKSSFAHIKTQNNKLYVITDNNDDTDTATDEGQVEDEYEVDEDNGYKIRAHENASLVIRNKLAAQTNFPLKVNLDTNELIVTTPKGEKTVTILPDKAVFNMLAANVLDQLGGKGGLQWMADQITPTSTPSADLNPTSTPSGIITPSPSSSSSAIITDIPGETEQEEVVGVGEESPIKLALDKDGNLVYEIDGIKTEKFLGIFKVKLNKVVIVSAETGELIKVKQNLANKILDLLSVD
ncbi:hypothetical protein JXA63_01015 [Candidatus Woesebacteria bacterium]|nr:hypothetical protein [Candidatus Woesebacteria bacterium]